MFKYEQIIIIYHVIRRLTGKFNTIYYAISFQIILFSDKNNLLIGVLKSENGEKIFYGVFVNLCLDEWLWEMNIKKLTYRNIQKSLL